MINIIRFIKTLLNKFLRHFGLKIFKISPYNVFDFEGFLYRHIAVHKTLSFLQIGANDGIMNDPIYQFIRDNQSVVRGYVLEPLPDIYEKLVENYKFCPNIKPFNFAIHTEKSEMILYRVKSEFISKVPKFARGIASFNYTHWKKSNLVPNKNYMEKVRVKCISLSNFIKKNKLIELDLLLIDTEGYDYEILMSIDFKDIKPKIIRFEHGVRDSLMPIRNFKDVCGRLNSFGYQIFAESYDATAYLLDPADLIF